MDWNVISAISDALAAIAVVVSLLYLAKQLREGRNEQQVENVYAATEGMNTIFLSICENEDLSRIFHAGLADPSSLTRDERHRFMTLFNVIVGRYGEVFYRHEMGTLNDGTWEGCLFNLKGLINSPGGKHWAASESVNNTQPKYREFLMTLVAV